MLRQILSAGGYLSIFLVPALLVTGTNAHLPWLAFGCVMLLFPMLRVVFGDHRAHPELWQESIASFLDRLPLIYGVALFVAMAWMIGAIKGAADTPGHAWGLGASLWITLVFATCVAHELIHRRSPSDVRFGHWIAGLAGYPFLGVEHLVHHARSGQNEPAEWPFIDESVWQFTYRRAVAIARLAGACLALRGEPPGVTGTRSHIREAMAVTALTWVGFSMAAGWTGFAIYGGVMVAVAFALQVITYVQHWGLGIDNVPDARSQIYAWEGSCRFQAWVTLHISFHQSHHRRSTMPFYWLELSNDSPRMPASYVVMMVLCLIPPLWRHLMTPILDEWKRDPASPATQGHRLSCFHAARGR